jgi:hypothetical protein
MVFNLATRGARARGARRRWPSSDVWLALVVFVGAAYFYGGVSWNQNARLDAIFTFVEPGPHRWTFRLDPFLPDPIGGINTGDWTRVGDHYYANKAPGTLLMGTLVYLPLYHVERAMGADLTQPSLHHVNAYVINLGVSVLPLALAIVCWARLFARQAGPVLGTSLALVTFFGTALFPYATQLWGHATAAAFVMFAVAALDARRISLSGACMGMAVLSDFLVLPILAGLGIVVARRERRQLFRFIAGGIGPALVLVLYLWYCFGSPFHLPTDGTNPMFVDDQRALGLFGWPSGVALFQLTVGPYRGLFLQMPLLLAAAAGFLLWRRRTPSDPLLGVCLGSAIVTLLWVSTFNGWHGGATVAGRYLIVVLPLVALALRELPASRAGLAALVVLAVPSLLNMLAIAAVSPLVKEDSLNPLFGEVLPGFFEGRLHPHVLPLRLQGLDQDVAAWGRMAAWNWGDFLGLRGLTRVLPWCALVATGSALACLSGRRQLAQHAGEAAEGVRPNDGGGHR